MVSFIRMLLIGVDPFEIYRVEKELARANIRVDRKVLMDHFLVVGQLDTLKARLTAPNVEQTGGWIQEACALDIVSKQVPLHNSDRIRNPFIIGLFTAASVLVLATIGGGVYWWKWRHYALPATYKIMGGIFAGLVAVSFIYAYLGAWVGKKKAQNIISGILVAGLLIGLWMLTRIMS